MNWKLWIFVCFSFGIVTTNASINGADFQNAVLVSPLLTNVSLGYGHIHMLPGTLYNMLGNIPTSGGVTLKEDSTRILNMEVDYARNHLYFYDIHVAAIYVIFDFHWQSNFTNLTYAVFHNGLSRDHIHLGFDWISKNLYWTDPIFRWIAIQNADSKLAFKILIDDNLERPFALAVDPINRYLFWSEIGSSVKIERSTLTGQDRKTIISTGLIKPHSIDIDRKSNTIVWVDAGRHTIELANYEGLERRLIQRHSHTEFYDIALFRDLIAVTDLQNKSMLIVNKNTGSVLNKISFTTEETLIALAIYSRETQPPQIDVCTNSGCKDLCIPDVSGPVCMCREGFMLNQDGRSCSEDLGTFHRAFVWSNTTHICLMDIRILSTTSYANATKCIYTQGTNLSHIDIDMNERKIIFADGSDILIVETERSYATTRLVASKSRITGLSMDWRNKNVYWSEGEVYGSIKLVSQITMNVYTVIDSNLSSPRNLLLLPLIDMMFWISGGKGSTRIERSELNGSNRKILVPTGSLNNPTALTADTRSDRLYFVDNGFVKSCKPDGMDLNVFVQTPAFFGPYMVLVYKNYLLVADRGYPGELKTLSITGPSATFSHSAINVDTMTDMIVLDASQQPEQKGPCELFNGGCEHVCISTGSSRECQCEYGFQLDSNRETCSSVPLLDNFLLLTDWTHNKIYQVSLVGDVVTAVDSETYGSPVGILFNQVTKDVIWSSGYSVHQLNIETRDYTMLFNTENYGYHIDRFAIDYTSGNIYYTAFPVQTSFSGVVGVLSPSGDHKQLIRDGFTPRAIALDPKEGLLFWTDHGGKPPFVNRANMDGTVAQSIITSGIVWPNGLAIDTAAKRLYLSDGATNIIQRCTYRGVCTVFYTDTDAHLMDIKLLGDYLYYIAWNRVYVTKIHKMDTTNISRLAEKAELGRLDSLSLYSSLLSTPTVSSECLPNNGLGPCSTFCLPKSTGHTCACEDGILLMNDGETCENVGVKTRLTTPSATARSYQTRSSTSLALISTAPTKLPNTVSSNTYSNHIHENKGLPVGAIAGGAAGFVLLIIVIVILVIIVLKRPRFQDQQQTNRPSERGIDISSIYRTPLENRINDTTYELITFDDIPQNECYYKSLNESPSAPLMPQRLRM